MRTKLLVDGDILLYEVVHALHKEVVFEDIASLTLDVKEAQAESDIRLASLLNHFGADEVEIAFSWRGEGHWRTDVLPDYKSARKHRPQKPLGFWSLRNYLIDTYECHEWEPLEADDVLGILSTRPGKTRRIIVSTDKDMRTIPGLFAHGWEEGVEEITEEEADRFFMHQTLMGDKTDGYAGCPGIGAVKSKRLLEPLGNLSDMWRTVVATYQAAGLGEKEALATARVARILRHGEYNKETKEIKLWEPPK